MTHFNQLSPAEAERLAVLAEECAEVIQAVGKIQRHGYASHHPDGGPNNREHLEEEIGHIDSIVQRMIEAGDLTAARIVDSCLLKRENSGRYLHHN